MKISDNVMIAEGIAHKAPQIIQAIEKGKKPRYKLWYAVTSAREPENLMYILSSAEYRLPVYHDGTLKLLGLAGSRKEAVELVLEIIKKGYHNNMISEMKCFIREL